MSDKAIQPTTELSDKQVSIKKGYNHIIASGGITVGGIKKSDICNSAGVVIAKFLECQRVDDGQGGTKKVRIYRSDGGDEYKLDDSCVYKNDEYFGRVLKKKSNTLALLLLALAVLILTFTIIVVALIDLPYANEPVIKVRDNDGDWSATGTVAVFDEKIHPGSTGSYNFIVRNDHNVELKYSFTFSEYYNNELVESCPLQYRIRMNNGLLVTDEWRYVGDLSYTDLMIRANSEQVFTLEWRWLFESGDDERDTLLGIESGTYNLVFNLTAQVADEDIV
jgi:hypothetical protein